MKKNLILSLLFAAACSFAGVNSAQAQTVKGADVPAMQADVQTMADEVMANQLNDPDEANKTFAKLVKKIKNDKEQLVAVGNFFLEKKIYPCANQCAKQAYTIDRSSICAGTYVASTGVHAQKRLGRCRTEVR